MQPNDVLRRVRYALNLRDNEVARMMSHEGRTFTKAEVRAMMVSEADPTFSACSDDDLAHMLDGLILDRRGPPPAGTKKRPRTGPLSNNAILQKLRIAMRFDEKAMLRTLEEGGMTVSKQELSALFRAPTHRNHRICGDQLLKAFLGGLARRPRDGEDAAPNGDDAG